MPEGDAVWRTARRLHAALSGQRITSSDLRVPSLATVDLRGRRTIEVVPRGKHLLHRIEGDLTLHSHLRMEGRWRTYRASIATSPKVTDDHRVRAILTTVERCAVGASLGMLDLVRTSEEDSLVGHVGPDLLDPSFDVSVAMARLWSLPERAIAEALLDQRNLAGIGTIFASEPLFVHEISPWTALEDVGEQGVRTVVETARRLLVLSCRLGRTTSTGRADTVDDAWVHGRVGLPCKKCGSTIRLAPLGTPPQERVMFYCPRCQGGLAPTDAGAHQNPLGYGRRERDQS
ncbi:MAG: DNA-formamidopyrimidine glycosylase family protein [Ornithinimicrobium sp.]